MAIFLDEQVSASFSLYYKDKERGINIPSRVSYVNPTGPYWTLLDPIGPYWTPLDRTEPHWTLAVPTVVEENILEVFVAVPMVVGEDLGQDLGQDLC